MSIASGPLLGYIALVLQTVHDGEWGTEEVAAPLSKARKDHSTTLDLSMCSHLPIIEGLQNRIALEYGEVYAFSKVLLKDF
jgi:hypothetical protein